MFKVSKSSEKKNNNISIISNRIDYIYEMLEVLDAMDEAKKIKSEDPHRINNINDWIMVESQ